MAIITRPKTDSSHWYDKDGKPCHTQPTKEGNDVRPTTIRDARKLGLIPSVTNVLNVISKDALTTWKVNQAIMASLKHGINEGEAEENYCKRIAAISTEQVFEAADRGRAIHAGIEEWINEGKLPDEPEMLASVRPVVDWIQKTGIKVQASERILVDLKHGYAGTADLLFMYGNQGQGCGVIDFKTRKSEQGKKMQAWNTEPLQLAAYAHTAWGVDKLEDCLIANILISTTEPGRFEVVKHAEPPKHFRAFLAALKMWQYLKGYEWEAA
jgi:hypothetical protein